MEALNRFPAVDVVTEVTTLLPRLICVLVPMSTCWPPLMFKLLPTVRFPSVVVPMPPFATDRGKVRSGWYAVLSTYKLPRDVERTKPAPKELMDVDPFEATVSRAV